MSLSLNGSQAFLTAERFVLSGNLNYAHISSLSSNSQYKLHISLIFLTTLFHRLGLWQPSSSFKTSKTYLNRDSEFERKLANRMWWHYAWIYIGCVLNTLLTTSLYTAHSHFHSLTPAILFTQLISTVLTFIFTSIRLISISPQFGLGRMFTYNITLTQNHKLITTGPYKWVRHPGYTGLFGLMAGAGVGHWGAMAGFVISTARSLSLWQGLACLAAAWTIFLWSKFMLYVFQSLHTRSFDEDKLMEKEFGREWKEWSRSVRWRYLVWIY